MLFRGKSADFVTNNARRTRSRKDSVRPENPRLSQPSNSRTTETRRNHTVEKESMCRAHEKTPTDKWAAAGKQRVVMSPLSEGGSLKWLG